MSKSCSLCEGVIKGYGHNPNPIPVEVVCDTCNEEVVIPHRLKCFDPAWGVFEWADFVLLGDEDSRKKFE